MKKLIYMFLLLLPLIQACSDNEIGGETDDSEKVEVSIQTQVETKTTVVTSLGDGDEMNVYAKSYGSLDATDLVSDIRATNQNGIWNMTPTLKIGKGERAFIYATSPYSADNTNPQAINIDVTQQQDVLYSGAFVPVTYTSHEAKLNMKHALMLLTFNILPQGYTGKGVLESISVKGNNVFTTGTMDVSNGKITGIKKDLLKVDVSKTVTGGGWTEDLPRLWSIPFSSQTEECILTMTLDGKTYEALFPNVEMKSGFQYIFRLALTNNVLQFIPGAMETVSLNMEEDQPDALQQYGVLKFTHHGSNFTLPTLLGENVFGIVDWGDNNSHSYETGLSHEYSANNTQEVIVESWNTTGFELNNLKDIDIIDISQY